MRILCLFECVTSRGQEVISGTDPMIMVVAERAVNRLCSYSVSLLKTR